MIKIKMDDGVIYNFKEGEYDDYDITKEYIVVKRKEQWVGIFDKKHFISLGVVNGK